MAFVYGQRLLSNLHLSFMQMWELTMLEGGFVLLGLAGLFTQTIGGLIRNFVIVLAFS